MTDADVIALCRKGARDALEMAELACDAAIFDHALFNCHLSVEQALKALFMEQHHTAAPDTHNLRELAETLDCRLSQDQKAAIDELTGFFAGARHSDLVWVAEYANHEHATQWVFWTRKFLFFLGN